MNKHFIFLVLFGFTTCCLGNTSEYEVEKVLDNGYYIINGVSWKPHTSCRTLAKGDRVKFVNGNPNGECVTATIIDLNSNSTCLLWCETEDL